MSSLDSDQEENEICSKKFSIFENGSCWLRADFHLHTKADKEFAFDEPDNSFVAGYIAALKLAKINIGVITNHNKFDRDEFKALSKAGLKEEIFLIPGVELSVKDGLNGIHILVVFSPDWIENKDHHDYIRDFLNVTFSGQSNYENENGRSNHDLNETIRELNKFNRDYFFVCAHVEDKSGLWSALEGGRRNELNRYEPFRERCLGFQKVRTRDQRLIVKAQMPDCYPAELEGSDCKSLLEIGKGKVTYLKVGAFTFEAIKFALLDHQNRVKNHFSESRHSWLKNISFQGGKLDGVKINLSSELNTFIGIRGSGKSSILECIRYALGIEFGKNAAEQKYKEGSPLNALGSGGKITLAAVDKHGQNYEIQRIIGDQPDVHINGKLQAGINIRETVINKPIYFGQKDLSSTGVGFENDLVEKLVGEKLVDIRHSINIKRQEVVELVRRLQKLSDVAEKLKEYEAKKQDSDYRLKFFKTHGVEEKLQKQVDFEQDSRAVKEFENFLTSYNSDLEDFIGRYSDEFGRRAKYHSKQNSEFFRGVQELLEVAQQSFLDLKKAALTTQAVTAKMVRKS